MVTKSSESMTNEQFLESLDETERKIYEHYLEYNTDSSGFPYLVRGAVLRCTCGSHKRKLNLPICHGVYATVHPMVHELDCEVGDDKNIPTFGVCDSPKNPQDKFMGETVLLVSEEDPSKNVKGCPCTPVIVGGRWLNPHPTTKIAENNAAARWMNPVKRIYHSALTTDSFLVCAYGGLIEPLTSGQENIETQGLNANFNPQTGALDEDAIFLAEMEEKYPGLRELLEDPYSSLYLDSDAYKMALDFGTLKPRLSTHH